MTLSDRPSLSEHLEMKVLSDAIQGALQETIFSSGLRISPRRTGEISRSIAQSFFDYYDSDDWAGVRMDGGTLAVDGLSPQSFLAATEALRQVCTKKSNPLEGLPDLANAYATTLTLGYIESRERRLLEQQERTHHAFIRAQNRDEGSL